MKEIRMVDLNNQYLKIKPKIDEAIHKVIDSTGFINGSIVKEFTENLENYLNVKHVIPCGNGTDALQVSLMALDLKPGDEVITTTFTFIATAEAIALLGLVPVLVDVEPDSFNINARQLEKLITKKTKAIIPVHLFGQCADMKSIIDIAKKYNLSIIEDTCQAIGADYYFSKTEKKKAGTIGDIGCTSFFPSKNLGAFGDGGAIFTNNDKLAAKIRSIVNHGMQVRYYHDKIGVNSRLDSIQAAVLNVKLKYLDDYNKARQAGADYYNKAFAGCRHIITPQRLSYSSHVFHQYSIQVANNRRNELKDYLESKAIPAMIYYPVPIHLQKAYKSSLLYNTEFPVSESLSKSILSLPIHTELDEEQLSYISKTVLDFFNKD